MDNFPSIGNISNTTMATQTDTRAGRLHGEAKASGWRGGGCTGLSGTTVLGSWLEISWPEGLEEHEMTARNAIETFSPALVLVHMGEPHQGPYQLHFLCFCQKYCVSKNWRNFYHCFPWCAYPADKDRYDCGLRGCLAPTLKYRRNWKHV